MDGMEGGQFEKCQLSDGVFVFAMSHEEINERFLPFRVLQTSSTLVGMKSVVTPASHLSKLRLSIELGHTGVSSVQTATFDWMKTAVAAAFVGSVVQPTHEELKGAFPCLSDEADRIYPGWKEKLGHTGGSSVQTATFVWQKTAGAAAFVGSAVQPSQLTMGPSSSRPVEPIRRLAAG